ncbi:hypothetical protein WJX73_002597 [Symbiochloris irregularis]|uniref:C2 Aida-type domain-containing protein n=1 Tax=Symbiochloris irregularis TaxID=706552 RepID=A0AAW1NWJ2_9CHLO
MVASQRACCREETPASLGTKRVQTGATAEAGLELEDIEAELSEAVSMRAEAQELGEADVIAELVAHEEKLQADREQLKAELLALQAQQAASASAALRARMAKLRESSAARSQKGITRQGSITPRQTPRESGDGSATSAPTAAVASSTASTAAAGGGAASAADKASPAKPRQVEVDAFPVTLSPENSEASLPALDTAAAASSVKTEGSAKGLSSPEVASPQAVSPPRMQSPSGEAGSRSSSPSKYRHASSKALPAPKTSPIAPSAASEHPPPMSKSPAAQLSQTEFDVPPVLGPLVGAAATEGAADAQATGDMWGSLGQPNSPPKQRPPERMISVPSRPPPPPPAQEPEDPLQQNDSMDSAWSGNPFMDFKMSGGLSSNMGDHTDSFQASFPPRPDSLNVFATALPEESPEITQDDNSFQASFPPAGVDFTAGYGSVPKSGFESGTPTPTHLMTQQKQAAGSAAAAEEARADAWSATSWDLPAVPTHSLPGDSQNVSQMSSQVSSRAQSRSQSPLKNSQPPQMASPEKGQPPSTANSSLLPSPTPSHTTQQSLPAFSDSWADFNQNPSGMLSLDRTAFGSPQKSQAAKLSVSLPSKQSLYEEGSRSQIEGASDSWGGSSRASSPARSTAGTDRGVRVSTPRAADNPFDDPGTTERGSFKSKLSSMMGRQKSVKKLGEAVKGKWLSRATTDDEGPSGAAGHSDSEEASSRQRAPMQQDSLGIDWGGVPVARGNTGSSNQPVLMNTWSDVAPARDESAMSHQPNVMTWPPVETFFRERCEAAFRKRGDVGMRASDVEAMFARLNPIPPCGADRLFKWCDVDGDGALNARESTLLTYMLSSSERTRVLPPPLRPAQAAHLLGEPAPASDRAQSSPDDVITSQIPSHLSPWLQPINTSAAAVQDPAGAADSSLMSPSTTQGPELRQLMAKGYHEDDCKRALFLHANDVKPALEWLSARFGLEGAGASSDLSSSLSLTRRRSHLNPPDGGVTSAPKGFEYGSQPSTPGSRGPRLQIQVEKALVAHYKRPLEGPFFAVTLRDATGALIEKELHTPPGHFDKEQRIISVDHSVTLRTPISELPEGSAVYFEIRHYKAAERRLSTLAWSFIPTEAFVLQQSAGFGVGPGSPRSYAPRVRTGPMFLSLYHKPTDEKAHARSHLHHAAAIARRGPKPLSKQHDLFVNLIIL